MLGTSLSISRQFSKDSFLQRSNRSLSVAIPKEFELETKDRVIFGLCNYDDIDNYFNGLCKENQTKMSAVHKIANYTKSAGKKLASSRPTFEKKILPISSSTSLGTNVIKTSIGSNQACFFGRI